MLRIQIASGREATQSPGLQSNQAVARQTFASYGWVIVTPSLSRSDTRPPCGMHAPNPIPFVLGAALNSVCAVAVPVTGTVLPPTSIETPFAVMNTGAFPVTTLRITCVPTGSVTPLLPLTGVTVVVVNLSPSLLLLLHTRDPLASSSVVPGPMFPVFATGAAGGGGGGGGAGAGAAAGVVVVLVGCVAGADCVAGAVEGIFVGTGAERALGRGAGSLRAGARVSAVLRCAEAAALRSDELDGADAGATAAGGVADFEWKTPSWLSPVTAAVMDPTSAAAAVRYPGAD
jgi:hypothetical protein